MKLRFNQEELETLRPQIEIFKTRFKGSLDEFQIMLWLNNFRTEYDRRIALDVLGQVDYYEEFQMIELYELCLKEILKNSDQNMKFIVLPIADFGKSGTAMIYFLTKTDTYEQNRHRFKLLPHYRQLKPHLKEDIALVLVDDFLGTGNSAIDFYNHAIGPQVKKVKVVPKTYFISTVSLIKAKENIESKISNSVVYSFDERDKVFKKYGSPFGSYKKMKPVRELCYKYGRELNRKNPLGYDNSQALITFSYGCPNNSLPIFWSSLNNWYPIFPRFFEDKVSRARYFRKETIHCLSIMKNIDSELYKKFATGERDLGWKTYNFITNTDFQLFSLLRLKRIKKPKYTICQILGINLKDYSEIVSEAVNRGILNNEEQLTSDGEKIYSEIARGINKINRESSLHVNNQVSLHVPRTFRGKV
ncbi:hypothetical protein ABE088_28730 [Priestia megaterium]